MNDVKKVTHTRELNPLEKGARNSVIWHLDKAGFTVSSIANIMSMNQSTVSRIVDKKPERTKLMDIVLWGKQFGEPRE